MRLATALLLAGSYPLSAQTVGSMESERERLRQIGAAGLTMERAGNGAGASDSALTAALHRLVPPSRKAPLALIAPEVRLTWNSELPYPGNDGPLWAGRGVSFSINGGAAMARRYGRAMLRVAIAPTLYYSQNLPFQIVPDTTAGRSAYANPFHAPGSGASLDLPLRFGDRHVLGVDPGRSELAVRWPEVTVGVTARNEWWGPGIRNSILMSNAAPGIPRVFVETTHPVRTPAGRLSARLISGTLTRSLFFDSLSSENRTLSGILVELAPAFDSTLTLGFSRVVYAPVGPLASQFTLTLARSFDALTRWQALGAEQPTSDQIAAVFARWTVPATGFEVYGEWARMDLPRSATELLAAPHHTGGWTFGFNWAQDRGRDRHLRLQSELTYLEQSQVFADRPAPDFYSGQASPQGYTQRGQVIGAAIGPGASSQWIAMDWIVPRWQAGAFIGRIRWDNDALYRQPTQTFWDHDVSLLAGARGGWRGPLLDYTLELTVQKRFNYLFQNGIARPGGLRTVDVNNVSMAIVAFPR